MRAGGDKYGIVTELHKAARRNFPRRYVTIKGADDLFQADLVEMIPYSKQNKGHKYLLTVVDAFSKRAWARALKSKAGVDVARAVRSVLEEAPHPPKYLQTDQGTDFYNANVSRVLRDYGIKHYHSFSPLKATLIERFNRTLKTWMWKEFSLRGTYDWISHLDRLLLRYNTRTHRTTGLAPISVNYGNEKLVLARIMKKKLPKKRENKYKVGDPVRISKFKHEFEKGYTPNWTTEVFFIDKVQKTVPVTYKLRDSNNQPILGGFYELELQKTKYKDTFLVEKVLRRKGDKVYVKWLGFDKNSNQWIKASDLQD